MLYFPECLCQFVQTAPNCNFKVLKHYDHLNDMIGNFGILSIAKIKLISLSIFNQTSYRFRIGISMRMEFQLRIDFCIRFNHVVQIFGFGVIPIHEVAGGEKSI